MKDNCWKNGTAPIAVIMITLNEGHNLREVLENLRGWASEVFILDSFSSDNTIDIALEFGVTIYQTKFKGFGEQWNFALDIFDIKSPWTMKLDPDERLTPELKSSLHKLVTSEQEIGITLERRLWFMGEILPVKQTILRVWPTGKCRFTDVTVNEHPVVNLPHVHALGYLEHKDSPNLDHWIAKQNRYTTQEAVNQFKKGALADKPKLFGTSLQKRMWLKKYFWKFPGRFFVLFIYHYLVLGSFKAGKVGYFWAKLRTAYYRTWELKLFEIKKTGMLPIDVKTSIGQPDPRVKHFD